MVGIQKTILALEAISFEMKEILAFKVNVKELNKIAFKIL